MLNKEYPYNGKNELLLFKDINSGKKLKLSNDDKLNDLINKMLKININERISWNEYFNHPFFNDNFQLNLYLYFLIDCSLFLKYQYNNFYNYILNYYHKYINCL